jgi:hypothetical protein
MRFPAPLVIASVLWTCPFLHTALASANTPVNTAENLLDPFHVASVFQTNLNDTESDKKTSRALTFEYFYGFENGVVLGAILPVIFYDTPPADKGESLPRLGGAANDRLELDSYYRFYGNAANYLGFQLGVGFPFQTSEALKNTSTNSWIIPAAVLARLTEGQFAYRGILTEIFNGPQITPSNIGNTYQEVNNSLSFASYISVFPASRFSPYFRWTEGWPDEKFTGTDGGNSALIEKFGQNARSRTFGFGFDSVPFHAPILLSFEADYKDLPATGDQTAWSLVGRLRWAF